MSLGGQLLEVHTRILRPKMTAFTHSHKSIEHMMTYKIIHRWNAKLIALVEAETYAQAVELAVSRGLSLLYADLRGVKLPGIRLTQGDFRGAELSHAELVGANFSKADLRAAQLISSDLRWADLRLANLRQADLRGADLRYASLEQAQLVGADLRDTLLTGAQLEQAILDWRWSSVAVELLRRDGVGSRAAASVMARLAFEEDVRPFQWLKVLIGQQAQATAALRVFSRSIRPGDNAPELLRRLVSNLAPGSANVAAAPLPSTPVPHAPLLWTRRAAQNPPAIF
jgi:hypothetical protein